jgi:hypothetical protein
MIAEYLIAEYLIADCGLRIEEILNPQSNIPQSAIRIPQSNIPQSRLGG